MQAEFMGKIIISTPGGFKIAGQQNKKVYPKTKTGLLALTQAIKEMK